MRLPEGRVMRDEDDSVVAAGMVAIAIAGIDIVKLALM